MKRIFNDDDDEALDIREDEKDRRVSLSIFLKASAVEKLDDDLLGVVALYDFPALGKFNNHFTLALDWDYNRASQHTRDTQPIRWARRLAFSTPAKGWVSFETGDFIVIGDSRIARLDGISIHRVLPEDPGHVFIRKGGILECIIYNLSKQSIIGLPALHPQKEWVIERKDGTVLHAQYDGYFV